MQKSRADSSAPSLSKNKLLLGQAFQHWAEDLSHDGDCPTLMVHQMNHQYSQSSLSYNNLKGIDAAKAECLQDASSKNGFVCFLGMTQHSEEGECDGDDDVMPGSRFHWINGTLTEELTHLVRLLSLDGTCLCSEDIQLEKQNFLSEEPWDRLPEDEDYTGETGNEGISTTHFYKDSVRMTIEMRNYKLIGATGYRFDPVGRIHQSSSTTLRL